MSWFTPFSKHLYLRIWLAVVLGVAALMRVVGWAWSLSVEHNTSLPPPREMLVLNAQGEVISTVMGQVQRGVGLEFDINLPDGQALSLVLPRRANAGPRAEGMAGPGFGRGIGRDAPPWWARPPYGFIWMLALVGLAVAIGVYPIVRRLTQRLEALQQSVQRWGEGDLTVRMAEQGQDEVADLSRHFNAAAMRVQSLMSSQQALLVSQKSLLANASHELRSPLARIRMGLELIRGDASEPARLEIARNIEELNQLIDEILLASRLDAQEADMGTVESVDLIGLSAEECARVGATLDLPEGLATLTRPGVTKLLRRLVRNLLENALRYGARAGSDDIRLSWELSPLEIVLRVSDRGPGVPPGFRERIFEPFYRLPGASERAGSVGLGLALVKSIALRHRGSVECQEREGGGASFVVRFPITNV